MTTFDQKLSRSLLFLPIDLLDKVFLWLAYRELKPVSEISLTRQKRKSNKENLLRIEKWLRVAGLHSSPEKGNCTSLHVGKDMEKVLLSSVILRSTDYDNEIKTGILLGYPEASVKAYAINRNLELGQNPEPLIYPGFYMIHENTKSIDYLPYLVYAATTRNLSKELSVAKKWAQLIRTETPILAKWYEDYFFRRNVVRTKIRTKWIKKLELYELPMLKLFSRYTNITDDPKQKILLILSDFYEDLLDEFQVASMGNMILQELPKEEKDCRELTQILKRCMRMYQSGKRVNLKAIVVNSRLIYHWYKKSKLSCS
ncbi:TPA: hypothetical protein DIU27_01465 [Candidatus Collierbacteria bacterium]|uniref:Uncharacterized protein n=1 Tax=Candidatus Collierbacteria bacterium GW2011_GWB2_44_22 TaxID=1618387 RepID=A0A0G1KW33_9BACT|nr:MAG: hypothetical protein UW31_C0015G0043 [Candidatus Collierbacteria bacterium GW2011_GWA2_44_13]KKT52099.1 MAG: hypothetical protein UW44_C0004G0004 [Candidatus Collierbacteria bacterium GW2011_GWB2_44_22]KKT63088.1 MAG: hypothetical protein UW56_C0002G0073 [Candidatus Collierbacteria bacterium GW2011_GWD1_44_27]KKT66302.1 MAG: hypothetical protein UW58_C0010G0004 [Candidatus Collierbacteria bacterium GW2011_GWC2_44_30]KKT68975.1 MAG: hypothetical protein UW64_C0006G0031 [Microgenomates gr